jgi:hypothetical protein
VAALHAAVIEEHQGRWLRKPSAVPPQEVLDLKALIADDPQRGVGDIDEQNHLNRWIALPGSQGPIYCAEGKDRPRLLVVEECEVLLLEPGDGPPGAICHHDIDLDLAFRDAPRRWERVG